MLERLFAVAEPIPRGFPLLTSIRRVDGALSSSKRGRAMAAACSRRDGRDDGRRLGSRDGNPQDVAVESEAEKREKRVRQISKGGEMKRESDSPSSSFVQVSVLGEFDAPVELRLAFNREEGKTRRVSSPSRKKRGRNGLTVGSPSRS